MSRSIEDARRNYDAGLPYQQGVRITRIEEGIRVTGLQIPFGQVFVLVFKFYAAAILLGLIVGAVFGVIAVAIGASLTV